MALQILDGQGRGYNAGVTAEGLLRVQAQTNALQFHHSREHEAAYQVQGDFASVNNSTHTVLHLKNTSATKLVVVTYIRCQFLDYAGGTALPNVATYWGFGLNRTVSSGGTAVTPLNMNASSGNSAAVTATDNNPTMAGTFAEFDRWYPKEEGQMLTYNKEGSLILGQNDTFEIRITSDHTSGVAQARISFIEYDPTLEG
jgi:hypothetical protein